MIIYPTIELKNGKCVSLNRGRIEEAMVWHVDPVEKAKEFAAAGAELMQVTDFDAIDGVYDNHDLILDIIHSAGISVQLAGGFRTIERIEEWIDHGAGRIVVGTSAVRDPDMVRIAAERFPDQIVLSIDVFKDKVMTDGWRKESMFGPIEFVQAFADTPLAAILFTDVDADVEQSDASAAHVSALAKATKTPVIASGMVRTIDDISMLKYTGLVAGAVVGRGLFNKTIKLDQALDVARPAPESVATFI